MAKLKTFALPKMPGLEMPRPRKIDTDLPSGSIKGKRGSSVKEEKQWPTSVPESVKARPGFAKMTLPEYVFGWVAQRLGYRWDEDIIYQYGLLEVGPYERGPDSTIADWLAPELGKAGPPTLAIYVNGNYWHYQRGYKIIQSDLDQIRRIQARYQFDVVIVDEDDLARDPFFHVKEALEKRRGHSFLEG
jgi:hypothetical protein